MLDPWIAAVRSDFQNVWSWAFDRARDFDKTVETLDVVVVAAAASRNGLGALPFASHTASMERKVDKACRGAALSTWGARWQGGWAHD